MDFKDQLKKHFPDHKLTDKNYEINEMKPNQNQFRSSLLAFLHCVARA